MKDVQPNSSVFASVTDLAGLKERARQVRIPQSHKQSTHGIGTTKSPFKSKGMDFSEVRTYQAGDDIRQIDWRVTAKYGKPFTKLYVDEKDRPIFLVCDERTGMKFASHGDFKSIVSAKITAFLAWIGNHHHHSVQTLILTPTTLKFDSNVRGDEALFALMRDLSVATDPMQMLQEDIPTLEKAFFTVAANAPKGSAIFICSDFHDLTPAAVKHLVTLSSKASVALVHIYDEMEKTLPEAVLPITDGKDKAFIDMKKTSNRQAFTRTFEEQATFIQKTANTYGFDYIPLRTNEDYLSIITRYSQGV